MFSVQEAVARFQESIPEHDCEKETCQIKGGFYIFVSDEGDQISIQSGAHNVSADTIVQAFISVIDESYANLRPEGMPASLAYAHGREVLRRAIEEHPAPGDVSQDLAEFLHNFIDSQVSDDE